MIINLGMSFINLGIPPDKKWELLYFDKNIFINWKKHFDHNEKYSYI